MTEKDIAESLTQDRLVEGIEQAEEEVLAEYDRAYSEWSGSSESGDVSRVNSLEQSLVALRVARQVLSAVDVSDEKLQDIATMIPCEDASVESMEATVEVVEEVLCDEDESISVSGPSSPAGPSL